MKYKTFRALVVAGMLASGALVIVLAVRYCGGGSDDQKKKSEPAAELPRRSPEPVGVGPQPVAPPVVGDERGQRLRDMDTALIALAGKPLAGGKGKDALGGRQYKVNLYQDAGKSLPNRAKIDLDRDDKWDEKWTFEDGGVKRQVAPADDEQYTEEYQLVGDRWLTAADLAAPPPKEETPPPSGGDGLSAMHTDLLELSTRVLPGGKGKDVFSGKPYKVNVYQDAGQELPNRAKIDLDRDDKWDEKWDFEGPASDRKVKRHVAPADDEQYTEEYRLSAGRWVRK